MAKFLDYEGLAKYDALVKSLIEKGDTELANKLAEIVTLIENNDSSVDGKIAELTTSIAQVQTNHSTDMQLINTTISALETKHDTEIAGLDSKITQEIAALVDGAPEAFDTLKEIATWIGSDSTGAAELVSSIAENAAAIAENKALIDADMEELAEHIELADSMVVEHNDRIAVVEKMLGIDSSDSEFEGEDIFTKLDNLDAKHDADLSELNDKHDADIAEINERLAAIELEEDERDSRIEDAEIDALFGLTGVADSATLNTAFTKKNSKIVLYNDVTMTNVMTNYLSSTNITLDLQGHTLTLNGNNARQYHGIVAKGRGMTIKNGTINYVLPVENDTVEPSIIYCDSYANGITLENVKLTSNDAKVIGITSWKTGAVVNIKDCIFDLPQTSKFGIAQNGTYAGTTYNIENTKINTPNGIGVYVSNSATGTLHTVNVKGCTITSKDPIEVKHSNLTATNNTITVTATEQKYVSNDNGTCCEGYGIAITSTGDAELTGSATISGNTFKEVNGNPVYVNAPEGSFDITSDADVTYKA